ncbi:hypothetical protein Glove_202g77 [Diversispora epigaea]|uniref:Uncharacterized protein n=1 Tax=Diversispora epigaea TaxID=1348612 RepID=A0A397IQX8_9GLOM|nr:hypothetical protein Glove_202g77 [Diversispora epigaea]
MDNKEKKKKCRKGRTHRYRKREKLHILNFKKRGKVIQDNNWKSFRKWLKRQGLPKTKFTLAEFGDTGRGLMATKDIKESK